MNALIATPLLVLAGHLGASEAPAPHPLAAEPPPVAAANLPASGNFTQTGITGLRQTSFGPITILEQTSVGVVTGTIDGTFEDQLRVVLLPHGAFFAEFTLSVDGEVLGQQGGLTLRAVDVGQLVGPTTASVTGIAMVTAGTGGLEGTTGLLRIAGFVDLVSGLASYDYTGALDPGN